VKAKRRQELKTNELAEQISAAVEFCKRHSYGLLLGGLLVGVAILAVSAWVRRSRQAEVAVWTDLRQIDQIDDAQRRLDQLVELAERVEGDELASAYLNQRLGDEALDQRGQAEDPGRRKQLGDRAEAAYRRALAVATPERPQLAVPAAVARMGLATLAEDRRDWAAARRHYQAVLDNPLYEKYPFKDLALQRMRRLDELAALPADLAPATQPTTAPAGASEAVPDD